MEDAGPREAGDFERDTAVREVGPGVYECEIHAAWWVVAGPNGGYLAAIIARALAAEVDGESSRPLRTITVHYLRAPGLGPARVEVHVERVGRSVTFLSARLLQDGRPVALALAVMADPREGMVLEHATAPPVPAPDEVPAPAERPEALAFAGNFHFRPALGSPLFRSGTQALTGGWMRLRHDTELDAALLTAYCDSWFPAVFAVADRPLAVPTLELTVHLRAPLPQPADWVLGRFSTRTARAGFLEEDAEIWSRDGMLLAQSRQLALSL